MNLPLTLALGGLQISSVFFDNIANGVVMSLGTIGVVSSLLNKTKIQCACLGTVFKLHMLRVALIEDFFLFGMWATMIVAILLS
jgi:hypothetical protein